MPKDTGFCDTIFSGYRDSFVPAVVVMLLLRGGVTIDAAQESAERAVRRMPQVQIIEPTIRPQKQKIRVCAYARVSSNSDDQLNSFSAQVEYFTQLIQAHSDWEFIDIYADEGITGTRADKRDDFQRMMRDCRAGRIDRILVKSISRFGRNSADCIEAVRELKMLGIAVAFEKEGIDTGRMTNEMYFSMYSAFSQEESTSIAKNMRKGAVMRMKNGTYRLSQAPYGYRLDEKGGFLICPEEAKVVRKIFGDFLSGKSIREIANELAQAQVPKLKGNPVWSATGVSYILTNERYMGDELFQKRFTTDAFPFKKVKNRGEKSQFYAENTHEAIVSPNVFRLAQELLKKKNQLHGRKKEIQTYTFSKMLECGECGSTFCRRVTKAGTVVWACYRHFRDKKLCAIENVQESEVESAFVTLYNKLGRNRSEILTPFITQVEKLRDKNFMSHPGAMQLNKEIADLLEQNHALATLRAKECIDSAFYMSETNTNNTKLENLRKELQRYRDLNDYHEILNGSYLLLKIFEEQESISEFEPVAFRNMVIKVRIFSDTICFRLINGMELAERR